MCYSRHLNPPVPHTHIDGRHERVRLAGRKQQQVARAIEQAQRRRHEQIRKRNVRQVYLHNDGGFSFSLRQCCENVRAISRKEQFHASSNIRPLRRQLTYSTMVLAESMPKQRSAMTAARCCCASASDGSPARYSASFL